MEGQSTKNNKTTISSSSSIQSDSKILTIVEKAKQAAEQKRIREQQQKEEKLKQNPHYAAYEEMKQNELKQIENQKAITEQNKKKKEKIQFKNNQEILDKFNVEDSKEKTFKLSYFQDGDIQKIEGTLEELLDKADIKIIKELRNKAVKGNVEDNAFIIYVQRFTQIFQNPDFETQDKHKCDLCNELNKYEHTYFFAETTNKVCLKCWYELMFTVSGVYSIQWQKFIPLSQKKNLTNEEKIEIKINKPKHQLLQYQFDKIYKQKIENGEINVDDFE